MDNRTSLNKFIEKKVIPLIKLFVIGIVAVIAILPARWLVQDSVVWMNTVSLVILIIITWIVIYYEILWQF